MPSHLDLILDPISLTMFTMFGTSNVFTLPTDPSFVGLPIGIQGADLGGAGGCVAPQVAFTDTMVVTIG